ncbi:MAG: hypothetical protein PHQ19_03890, partial [Candidatus Krumholzibacteria bacterium]|nr:hypothetical protein [Candidatus Krumholzibacteria bacterium]
ILIGDPQGARFLRRGPIGLPADLRRAATEYDPLTGAVFSYRFPGHAPLTRREEREGVYYRPIPRRFDVDGIELGLSTPDAVSGEVWRRELRRVWSEEVAYSLSTRTGDVRGRGGLIDINIPIALPKQLEAIFGRGEETRLTVSGREKITIGGTSRWCANCPRTEGMPNQQKFPDLDMEQQLTVNLHGNIGEKINVAIDHSSVGGGAPSTNRVRLNYTGFEDEIIKLIEMGDTDLTLSGAQLISYSAQAKGLFGVKGVAQIGPLDLTVVASKEEGESSSGTFSSSGGQSSETTIDDYNFIKRQFFYLETPGSDFSFPTPGFGQHYPVIGGAGQDSLELFVSFRVDTDWRQIARSRYYIKAYNDPDNDGSLTDGNEYTQWFYPLYEGVDFDLIQDYVAAGSTPKYIGIRLRQPLGADKALVVRYRMERPGDVVQVGDYGNFEFPDYSQLENPPPNPDVFLTAELICPPEEDFDPPSAEGARYGSTWNMMFRNVYSIGAGGLDDAALTVKIRSVKTIKGTPEIEEKTGERYLRIFGLDRYDGTGAWASDGFVDVREGLVNFSLGYIMFPSPQPFRVTRDELRSYFDPIGPSVPQPNDSVDAFVDTLDVNLGRNEAIYDEILDRNSPPNEYEIVIETSSGSKVFNLGAFDILDGTEVVTVDGVKLSRGSDYDIDYMGGVVTLKGDYGTLPPDAQVRIDYQHTPLFGGGKSSLLGVGGNLRLSENSRLNATFLYNSVGTPKYTPRLGEEPTRTMAADLNGSFQFEPGWMTSLANLLPRVDTDARSSFNLTGEVAASFPNPNTKGTAFVDDMEGIEDSDQLNLVRSSWYEASPPIDPDMTSQTLPAWPDGMEFYWYNPANTERQQLLTTSKQDLNPGLDDRENSRLTSLFIKAIAPGAGQWAGVMTGFPGGIDLSTAQYLEIWVNDYTVDPLDRRGILHVDFGKIDEDFHQPDSNRFDVENLTTWTVANDVGFPGDPQSRRFNGDFEDDKWDEERGIYRWINSRIGNSRPDSEDLNKNSRLDEANEYFSLELDLADTAVIDVQRDFPREKYSSYWNDPDESDRGETNRRKSWRMYRLDLGRADLPAGIAPRLDRIQHMRIWVENIDEISAVTESDRPADHMIELTGLKFVGSRWEWNYIRDLADNERPVPPPNQGTDLEMKVNIGTINNKDNPSIYTPPKTVEEEEGIQNREQSLLIYVENFEPGYSFRAMKRFFGQGYDFQQYREIQFFIRPDNKLVAGLEPGADSLEFYFQVAYDSLNYYEIAMPLDESHRDRWHWVNVLMSDLTSMKIDAPPDGVVESLISDSADPTKSYRGKIVGDPTLFKVRYLFAGLRNATGRRIPEGQIWFNDIILGQVRRDVDHAERLSGSANFANVVSVNASYQRTGPEFRSLKQKAGSGATNNSLALSGKTEVNQFIPTGGFQVPLTARYNSSESKPKYLPQSDVEIVDEAERDLRRTVRNGYALSVSMSRRNSKNFVMRTLFDNLKAQYSYSRNRGFSPTSSDTTWSQSWNTNYQIQFDRGRALSLPLGIKWRYWLTNFTVNASGAKSVKTTYSLSGDRFVKSPTGVSHGWDNDVQASYDPFESMKFNFRRSEKRNMMSYQEILGVPVGRLTTFNQSLDMQYQPRGEVWLISQFSPRFEYTSRYEEDLNPSVRKGDDPSTTRNANNERNINIVFDLDIGRYAHGLGRLAGVMREDEKAATAVLTQGAGLARQKEEFQKMLQDRLKPPEPAAGGREVVPEAIPGLATQGGQPADTAAAPGAEQQPRRGTFSDLLVDRPRPGAGRADTSAAKPDTAAAAAAPDTTAPGKGDPLMLLRGALRLVGRIQPVKSSIRFDDRSSYQRLYDRADWLYRYGFTKESGVPGSSCETEPCEPENIPLRASKRVALDLRSGVAITSNLSADVRFNLSNRTDEADARVTEARDVTWPDVSLSWKGLERWGLLARYIKQSDLTVNYVKKSSTSVGTERENFALAPNWNMTWKNSLSTNLSFSYSRQQKTDKKQEMWDRTWAANVELRYDIKGSKGFGIPLPLLSRKKFKFESTLTTVLNVGYSSTETYNTPPSTTLSDSPRFTYTFSRNVSGGLTASYKRSAGGIYGYINHEVALHATAEFKF